MRWAFFRDIHLIPLPPKKPPTISIAPGDLLAVDTPMILRTLLGSCVAVCLFDEKQHIAGLNHYLLAKCPPDTHPSISGRYACYALPKLLKDMQKLGANTKHMLASIFGGSHIVASMPSCNVGAQNVKAATKFLHSHKIPIVNTDTLGTHPRRIYFDSRDGSIQCERLPTPVLCTSQTETFSIPEVLHFQSRHAHTKPPQIIPNFTNLKQIES